MGEWDIENMFYNIPTTHALWAFIFFFSFLLTFCKCTNITVQGRHATWGATHRPGIAKCFSWKNILLFLVGALHFDVFIKFRGRIYKQIKGTAIGGILSAQISEIWALYMECRAHIPIQPHPKVVKFLTECGPTWVRTVFHQLSPMSVFPTTTMRLPPNVRLYRYRDNVLVFTSAKKMVHNMTTALEDMYCIPFKCEQQGTSLTSLGLHLNITNGSVNTWVRVKPRPGLRFRPCVTKYDTNVTVGGMKGEVIRLTRLCTVFLV